VNPTVWYFYNCSNSVIFVVFHFIPLLARIYNIFFIALCTVVVTYQSIYINQNVVIVNTNRNTTHLLFKSLFSVYCLVDHFRLLFPFFHLVVVLSISLKEQFEDTKGVVKTRKCSVFSLRSVLLVEEIGVHGENHRPTASHW
jgi:hypothetical protein